MKIGLTRSVYGLLLVLAVALVLRALLPTYTSVPSARVTALVALFAAGISYLMSYTAAMRVSQQVEKRADQA